jgi:hypothetical protein
MPTRVRGFAEPCFSRSILCECAGNPFLVQKRGFRTLPKKLSVCRLPLVADGFVFTSEPGIRIVRCAHSGMEVHPDKVA